jgi:small subunit ribosomal protein S7
MSPLQAPLVQRMVRLMLRDGKKTKAEAVALQALEYLRVKKQTTDPAAALTLAAANVSPLMEVRSVKVRGRTFRVPMPLTAKRSEGMGLKWMIQSARRKKRPMHEALAEEIVLAAKGQGDAMKKKEEVTRNAAEARTFAHYRW